MVLSFKEIAIRLILSMFLSGLIGLEREIRHRGAGLRTHILVSIGSTLIMLTSLYVFDIYKDIVSSDPARIASSVVSGIGFLCAGAIIRYGASVRGLTTAASLWISAAVGLAIGCGFYSAAIFTTLVVVVVLVLLKSFEKYLGKE